MHVLFCYENNKNEIVVKSLIERMGLVCQPSSISAFEEVEGTEFGLVILDLSHLANDAKKLMAISACKVHVKETPLLVLLGNSHDKLRFSALDHGADYCLIGVVSEKELEISVKSLTRESAQREAQVISCGPIKLDRGARTVELEGRQVKLTPSEYALLKALIRKPKQLVDTREILSGAQETGCELDIQRLQPHISRLRKKIMHPGLQIKSIYGAGYKLDLTS